MFSGISDVIMYAAHVVLNGMKYNNQNDKRILPDKGQLQKRTFKIPEEVFSHIPKTGKPKILDIGCGTGVPTLWLAENMAEQLLLI